MRSWFASLSADLLLFCIVRPSLCLMDNPGFADSIPANHMSRHWQTWVSRLKCISRTITSDRIHFHDAKKNAKWQTLAPSKFTSLIISSSRFSTTKSFYKLSSFCWSDYSPVSPIPARNDWQRLMTMLLLATYVFLHGKCMLCQEGASYLLQHFILLATHSLIKGVKRINYCNGTVDQTKKITKVASLWQTKLETRHPPFADVWIIQHSVSMHFLGNKF